LAADLTYNTKKQIAEDGLAAPYLFPEGAIDSADVFTE